MIAAAFMAAVFICFEIFFEDLVPDWNTTIRLSVICMVDKQPRSKLTGYIREIYPLRIYKRFYAASCGNRTLND